MLLINIVLSRIPKLNPLIQFFYTRLTFLYTKAYILEKPIKFISDRVILLQVKAFERYVPDRILLSFLKALDNRISSQAIDLVIEKVDEYVPNQVISSFLTTADEFVPDSVASSRKVSTIIAGVGKYIPDKIIPAESRIIWENLKVKFHIPTLLTRRRINPEKD